MSQTIVEPKTGSPTRQSTIAGDIAASIVVFLVALPLCLAIAQACGVPPEAGIVTGIVGGIVVGSFSGAPLQVSGPAAGLVVLVAGMIAQLGPKGFAVATVIAGAMQVVAGVCRLGPWFRAVSPAVIHGMLAGIGIILIASQFHVLVDDPPAGTPIQNILTIPSAALKAFQSDADAPIHRSAAIVGLCAMAALVVWNAKKPRKLKLVPGALVAVLVGIAVAQIIPNPIKHVTVQADLFSALHPLSAGDGSFVFRWDVWKSAMVIAAIASAETLLCATAVDRMHSGPRTQYNRELIAQGVGNSLCGFIGALPMTGVIVRSSANVDAGATTRRSTILHGVWLLALSVGCPALLGWVPTASLAAVLIVIGYNLIDFQGIRRLWKESRTEAMILIATAAMIVATDLLSGVLTGIALAMFKLLWTFSHLVIRRTTEPGERTVMTLEGAATFLRLPYLAEELEKVPSNTELHVDFRHLTYVDHACLELIMEWERQHETTGGSLIIDWDSLHARFKSPRRPASPAA